MSTIEKCRDAVRWGFTLCLGLSLAACGAQAPEAEPDATAPMAGSEEARRHFHHTRGDRFDNKGLLRVKLWGPAEGTPTRRPVLSLRAGATETDLVEDKESLPAAVDLAACCAVLGEEAARVVPGPPATIPWYLRQ